MSEEISIGPSFVISSMPEHRFLSEHYGMSKTDFRNLISDMLCEHLRESRGSYAHTLDKFFPECNAETRAKIHAYAGFFSYVQDTPLPYREDEDTEGEEDDNSS